MRLGLVREKYDQSGGAERTLFLLASGLLEKGHEVHVICHQWQGPQPNGLSLHRVNLPRFNRAGRLFAFARAARRLAEDLSLDTFLALQRLPHSPLYRAGDGCHAAWLQRRRPYVSVFKRFSFRLNPLHRAQLALERDTVESPRLLRVVANSRLVASELQEHYGLSPHKISLIYNGVDQSRLQTAQNSQALERLRRELSLEAGGPPALLFLGSGWQRKGLLFALAALARLPEALLLVAGRGRSRGYLRAARRLGVASRVRFLGARADAPQLLAVSSLLLLPTIYDPCSNACLEALALGRPVVTTRANGASELIKPGINGEVVAEPADAPALAAAVQAALALPEPRPSAVPSLEQMVGDTLSLMEQAALEAAS